VTTFTIIINDIDVTVIKSRCATTRSFFGVYRIRDTVPQNSPITQYQIRYRWDRIAFNESVLISLEILILLYLGYCRDRDALYVSFRYLMRVCVRVYMCVYVRLYLLSYFVIVFVITREFLISMYVTRHFIVLRSSIASRARELETFGLILSTKKETFFFSRKYEFLIDYQEKIAIAVPFNFLFAPANW